MSETVQVKGLAELQRFLDKLPAKIEANIMRGALRAGLKPIEDAAKNNIHHISGDLAKSIRVSGRIDKRKGKVVAKLKAGGKSKGVAPFYAGMVEYGTRPHLISVQENEKNFNRKTGRKETISTINRRVLQIGGNFIGPTVMHKGSDPHPFMRPALDSQAQKAVIAAGEYIKKRLRTKHGIDTSDIEVAAVDE